MGRQEGNSPFIIINRLKVKCIKINLCNWLLHSFINEALFYLSTEFLCQQ